ncbi:MAG: hypothetical protein ACREIV_10460, partial [Planctomycetaceae bacterium]
MSLIEISVLLNVALMCAMPSDSTFFRVRFERPAFFGFAMCPRLAYLRGAFFLPAIARREPL